MEPVLKQPLRRAAVFWGVVGIAVITLGLRAARFALSDALETAATSPRSEKVLAGARQMALTMGYGLALALLVEHAAATDDPATKAASELWGRARLVADDIAHDAHTAFDVLFP